MSVKRYNPEIHHRNSIRLKGYDYSSAGMYFVTVCSQGDENLFGGITNTVMDMNDAGRMVETWWNKIPGKFPPVEIDIHVVMPNHFHGIITINNEIESDPVGALLAAPLIGAPSIAAPSIAGYEDPDEVKGAKNRGEKKGAASSARTTTLGQIMRAFK